VVGKEGQVEAEDTEAELEGETAEEWRGKISLGWCVYRALVEG